jgi:hypothetical protein
MIGLNDEKVIDESLVLLCAQVGHHIVLVPTDDASSKHATMEGLVWVTANPTEDDEQYSTIASTAGQQRLLVNYETLDDTKADRPYGSYWRSRRLPTQEAIRHHHRQAVQHDNPWLATGLGESPSASLQARLAMSNVSLARYQG